MAIKNATKNIFVSEFKKMLKEMPVEKVRIGELCKRCGADRRTFYYHFMDKYDLVAWVFMQDYSDALSAEQGLYTLQHNINILRKMYDDRAFYRAVYTDNSQNAIRHYLYQYFYDLGTEVMKKHFELETLPPEKDYAVRSHAYSCIGITMDWLQGEVLYSPEEFAALQYRFMPRDLRAAYGIEGEY